MAPGISTPKSNRKIFCNIGKPLCLRHLPKGEKKESAEGNRVRLLTERVGG